MFSGVEVDEYSNFFDLGGDSMSAMQFVHLAAMEGIELNLKELLSGIPLGELTHGGVDGPPASGDISCVVLNAMQDFFVAASRGRLIDDNVQHVVLETSVRTLLDRPSVDRLLLRHPNLTARLEGKLEGPELRFGFSAQFLHVDCTNLEERIDVRSVLNAQKGHLSLLDGPVFSVAKIETPDQDVVCLSANHMVVDHVSWNIIITELMSRTSSPALDFPKPPSSKRNPYRVVRDNARLFLQDDHSTTAVRSSKVISLNNVTDDEEIQIRLLRCLFLSLATVGGFGDYRVTVEHHGRSPLDALVVGCFTQLVPIALTLTPRQPAEEIEQSIHMQLAEKILANPHSRNITVSDPQTSIVFNYLGKVNQGEGREFVVRFDRSGDSREHLTTSRIEFNLVRDGDELAIHTFSRAGTAAQADRIANALAGLAKHSHSLDPMCSR